MSQHKILIIDDEIAIREALRDVLEYENYLVTDASDASVALKIIADQTFDLIISDVKMPGMDGIELMQKIQEMCDTPVLIITGHGNIKIAVDAIKKGAFDFITKPLELNQLLSLTKKALNNDAPAGFKPDTKKAVKKVNPNYEIIGETPVIKDMKKMIDSVAASNARVLITGENGTGKELVAHWIHEKSNRVGSAFVEVNCAAIPSELIESELFGHEKGSFTSAIKQKKGTFELADNGTLFLDEIGDMSLSAQAKVLRALQENKITRVGGEKDISVNPRIVAATNKDLLKEIEKNNFREDLFHRLSVIIINVPPLRKRTDDIPLLVNHFSKKVCANQNVNQYKFTDDAIGELKKLPWKGNIRELHNVVERLIVLCKDPVTGEDVKKYSVNY